MDHFIQALKTRLSASLPGVPAQMKFCIRSKETFNSLEQKYDLKPAGTLLLLFPVNGSICFFLTKRTETLEHHKGQISLPGGVQEKGESLLETALRETREEIGINENIEILGQLSPLPVPVTGFEIHPFVGWLPRKPRTVLQKEEVDKILIIPAEDLMKNEFQKVKKDNLRGFSVDIPYFYLNQEMVWGATSMILSEFKTIISPLFSKEASL